MNKAFDNFQWQNKPSTATPLGKTNLQKLNDAIDTIDDRVIALDSGKVSSVTVTNTLATGDTIATITVDGTSTNIKSAQITVDSEISTTSTNPVQNKVIAEALREVMPEVTVEGNPISITDGSNIVPAKLAEVTFLPKQSGSGEPSPDNVRPISGWTEVSVKRTGVNIVDIDNAYNFEKYSGGTRNGFDIKNIEGTFTISGNGNTDAISYAYKNNQGVWREGSLLTTETSETFTTYGEIQIWCGNDIKSKAPKLQLEFGSTATSYEAYNGHTYTETLGATYYGGKVDFVSGELTITHKSIDLGDMTFTHKTDGGTYNPNYFLVTPKQTDHKSVADTVINYLCSYYKSARYYDFNRENLDGSVLFSGAYNNLVVIDTRFTDGALIKAELTGQLLCYELATPIELTLTPQEIELLKGNNVLWSDSNGNIKLTYSADIKAFIESQLQNS